MEIEPEVQSRYSDAAGRTVQVGVPLQGGFDADEGRREIGDPSGGVDGLIERAIPSPAHFCKRPPFLLRKEVVPGKEVVPAQQEGSFPGVVGPLGQFQLQAASGSEQPVVVEKIARLWVQEKIPATGGDAESRITSEKDGSAFGLGGEGEAQQQKGRCEDGFSFHGVDCFQLG